MTKEKLVVFIRKEKEPYSKTGFAYRAFQEDGAPLYMGEESKAALIRRVHDSYGHKVVEIRDEAT
jgi:hypothetical protein